MSIAPHVSNVGRQTKYTGGMTQTIAAAIDYSSMSLASIIIVLLCYRLSLRVHICVGIGCPMGLFIDLSQTKNAFACCGSGRIWPGQEIWWNLASIT